MHLSIVIPAYRSSACIGELHQRLTAVLKAMALDDYEIIFVNDGSPEPDWKEIRRLCVSDQNVKGINLTRNFGQHKAITAGIDAAKGQWVLIMDCDLQDQPEDIPKMYAMAQQGHQIVFARRCDRKDGFVKKLLSKLFRAVFNYLSEYHMDGAIANFSLIHRNVIAEIINMREQGRSHALLIYWLGLEIAYVNVEHSKRHAGRSAYDFRKSLNLAIDCSISQSNKPLKLFVKLGVVISALALCYGIYLIADYFISGDIVPGWTSIMVSMYFMSGMLLASIGVLGIYIGKIFDEVKARPIYAVKERINI